MIVASPALVPALAPVEAALATVRRRRGPTGTSGLHAGLLLPPGTAGWQPAARLLDDDAELDRLLAAAGRLWPASPHIAASLAWRSYTYWLSMPVVLGWAAARRVPLVDPADVLFRREGDGQLLRVGLRRLRLAVLPDDPLADGDAVARRTAGAVVRPEVEVVGSEPALLARLRHTLRDTHLDPLLERFRRRFRLGRRTMLGSVASAAGYAVLRGIDAPAPWVAEAARTVAAGLGVGDLVEVVSGEHGPALRRRTCCLAFALPTPKVCSGCPLASGRG